MIIFKTVDLHLKVVLVQVMDTYFIDENRKTTEHEELKVSYCHLNSLAVNFTQVLDCRLEETV